MTNSRVVPEQSNGRLKPIEAHGLKIMSFGQIYPGDQATVYRGPMVGKAIEAMMIQVDWGRLDYLVIDLPPGTGDASLTLAQAVPLTGVAIVCTPQDVATFESKVGVKPDGTSGAGDPAPVLVYP